MDGVIIPINPVLINLASFLIKTGCSLWVNAGQEEEIVPLLLFFHPGISIY